MFDLDGTLTRHDTLLPYLAGFVRRHPLRLARLPQVLPPIARFALGLADRGEVKSAAIRAALGGRSRTEIEDWTREFVSKLLVRGLHEDALAALEAHRRAGDVLVLLSASPDLYVPAIGRALGFTQWVCTELEWQGDRLGGRLRTPNRRGAEKAACVAMLRAAHPGLELIAYGNATSDLEHLVLADQPTLVNGGVWARRAAARQNVDCVTWH